MPDLATIVYVLAIIFWLPGHAQPEKTMIQVTTTAEDCNGLAMAMKKTWEETVNGGSASWACLAAYPAPVT